MTSPSMGLSLDLSSISSLHFSPSFYSFRICFFRACTNCPTVLARPSVLGTWLPKAARRLPPPLWQKSSESRTPDPPHRSLYPPCRHPTLPLHLRLAQALPRATRRVPRHPPRRSGCRSSQSQAKASWTILRRSLLRRVGRRPPPAPPPQQRRQTTTTSGRGWVWVLLLGCDRGFR